MTPQTPLPPTATPATTCDDVRHAADAAFGWPSPRATYRSPGPTPVDHHTHARPNAPQLYPCHPDVCRLTTMRPAHQRPPVAHQSSPNGTTHGRTHASRAPRPMRRSQMRPARPPRATTLAHTRPGPHLHAPTPPHAHSIPSLTPRRRRPIPTYHDPCPCAPRPA